MDVEAIIAPEHHAQGRSEGWDVVVNDVSIYTQHVPPGRIAGSS